MAFREVFIGLLPCNFFCGVNRATQMKINPVLEENGRKTDEYSVKDLS
jgi:hypothetical protein